jgi:hypothetical protein
MKGRTSRFLDDVFGVGEGKAMDDTWKQFPLTADGVKQQSHRTSDLVQLPRAKESEWLYERLMARGEAANAEYWHFTLNGVEEIQILRYKPWQSFKWHYDTFPGSARKLTCVVNLSSPESYWRGRLEVRGRHGRNVITRHRERAPVSHLSPAQGHAALVGREMGARHMADGTGLGLT